MSRTPSPQEIAILQALGVPEQGMDADRILIYDQAAHLDYDWLHQFGTYYADNGPWSAIAVQTIYSQALDELSSDPAFRYSTCEMAYLSRFVQDPNQPGAKAAITAAGNRFTIVGGGITSPDNLLSAGEAFIRCYLLGKLWLAATFPGLLPLRAAWIPDDFGHDPELPATLVALGLTCAAFQRVPGTTWQAQNVPLITAMYERGVDFRWTASDGSQVLAHFLQGGYGQGANGAGLLQTYIDSYSSWQDPEGRGETFPMPYGAPTPYLYVPTDNDFSVPLSGLASDLNTWNQQQFPTTGVWAVPGSFLDFAALVEAYSASAPSPALVPTLWDGTPYWTGHYASRPQLKVLHYAATRDLLAAEAVGTVAGAGPALWQQVGAAWQELAPSTHHDYICGTASDNAPVFEDVYGQEQLPNLSQAAQDAAACASAALEVLAGAVTPPPIAGETGVVLANPLGWNVAGLAELGGMLPVGVNGFRQEGQVAPVQATWEGGLLFPALAPSVGYATGTLTPQAGAPGPVTLTESGGDVWMENEQLRVRISPAAPCSGGIAELIDKATELAVLAPGAVGNDLVFYNDSGNVWQMGYEYTGEPGRDVFDPVAVTFGEVTTEVLERGTLRARVRTTVQVTLESFAGMVIREYALGAGEPFLRMTTTSTAPAATAPDNETPAGWTVTAAFPLALPVDALVHGTPNHWTQSQGQQVWDPPVFRATHRFLLPQAGGQTLAAIYHPEVPAWAWDGNGVLLGCINRNVSGFPLVSSEPEATQTVRYALRVPSGLGAPQTGLPLAESLLYATPTMAALTQESGTPSTGWSLATVTGGVGIILAVKPGDVTPGTTVLRLYQPTNGTETVEVTLGRTPASVIPVTALEDPIADGPAVQVTGNVFTITMSNALATVQVTWPDAGAGEQPTPETETRRAGCLLSLLGIGRR